MTTKTIAIIDDDIHIVDMLSDVLSQEGYTFLSDDAPFESFLEG